ncbi:MAG: immunity 26/phosphotriesterase HocA family protein [Planctomycetaceae bacterium]|nr:immunity 26/phosphotriesterase HocA family protein [Planctomycetaceae bacterium]
MLPYKEGTWFAVPLRQGGYATGVVARHVPGEGKIILAYFFGPKRDTVATMEELGTLSPGDAIKVVRVGDLGIMEGSWPLIGESEQWDREKWPIPPFIRKDDISKTAWRVVYADDNPNEVILEESVSYETSEYERDALFGTGAAEIVVTQLLTR